MTYRITGLAAEPFRHLFGLIERLFADPSARYIHAHYAKRGCFAARIGRA